MKEKASNVIRGLGVTGGYGKPEVRGKKETGGGNQLLARENDKIQTEDVLDWEMFEGS